MAYRPESGIGLLEGGLGRIAVDEKSGGVLDCDETGRYCDGMCAFSNGNSTCNSVISRVVEYLNDSSKKQARGGKVKSSTHPK